MGNKRIENDAPAFISQVLFIILTVFYGEINDLAHNVIHWHNVGPIMGTILLVE